VGELIGDHLPTGMPAAYRRSLGALMMLRLHSALRMARADAREQGPTPLEGALLDEQPPAAMGRLLYPASDDPDCSEGGPAAAPAGAERLLTQVAAVLHATLPLRLQRDVETAVHTGLAALCSSAWLHSMDAHFSPLLSPVLRAGDGHGHAGVYVVDW
jgi:hypothetical protein